MASMKTIAEANVMLGHPLVRDDGEAVKVRCHGSSSATHNNIGSALNEKARRIMADAVLDGVQTTRWKATRQTTRWKATRQTMRSRWTTRYQYIINDYENI